MAFDGSDVYQLAGSLGLPELEQVARAAGVMNVLQVTAYYTERRVRHSLARVIEYQTGETELRVAYEGVNVGKPMVLPVERDTMEALNAVLLAVNFGRLSYQAGLSHADQCLWLIQRAAGTHVHGIMLAPERPEPPWSTIVNAIDAYLPEAIREIPLRRR